MIPEETAIYRVVSQLRSSAQTLAIAESLTGGGLGESITSVPGASDVFLGGVIAYGVPAKEEILHVPGNLIAIHGVVSEEVAISMAEGALSLFRSTWAISTTGVAGPGESGGVPQGSVWVAIRGPVNESIHLALQGDRQEVRNATVSSAIAAFARILST